MDIKIDITGEHINTARLLRRPWEESDIHDFYDYASVPGVGEMAGWPHHDNIDISRQVLRSFIDGKNVFAIVYKGNGRVIGSLGLHPLRDEVESELKALRIKELGYALSKDYWGMGLMPEAVKAVILFCFENYKLDAIAVSHFVQNEQSKRVIQKCGFKYVGSDKRFAKQLNKEFDELNYILYR